MTYHIIIDPLGGPGEFRFVEIETPDGKSVDAGDWRKRDDGLLEIVIPGDLDAARYREALKRIEAEGHIGSANCARSALQADGALPDGENLRLRLFLCTIAEAHIPDQPATSELSELEHVRNHVRYLRGLAREALATDREAQSK